MEVGNITSAATFKSFLPRLLKHTITYFCDSAFQYFHETDINR